MLWNIFNTYCQDRDLFWKPDVPRNSKDKHQGCGKGTLGKNQETLRKDYLKKKRKRALLKKQKGRLK